MVSKLLIFSFSPLIVIVVIFLVCIVRCMLLHVLRQQKGIPDLFRAVLRDGVPLAILILFVLIPSISAQIFEAFVCDEYLDDSTGPSPTFQSYLQASPGQKCGDDPEYEKITSVANFLVLVWPVGMPCLFSVLLLFTRKTIVQHRVTPLSRATAFLYKEYEIPFFWWEPLEMVRKLILTGFVLIIPPRMAFVRLIVAEITCITSLMLISAFKPYVDDSDDYLAIGTNVALAILYLGASYIKLFEDVANEFGKTAAQTVLGLEDSWALAIFILFLCVPPPPAAAHSPLLPCPPR